MEHNDDSDFLSGFYAEAKKWVRRDKPPARSWVTPAGDIDDMVRRVWASRYEILAENNGEVPTYLSGVDVAIGWKK